MNNVGYYLGIINSVQEPILVIDRHLHIVDENEAARAAFGPDAASLLGCPCHQVTHGLERPCSELGLRCPVQEVFTTGKMAIDVHRHQRADGSVVWEQVLASPLMNEQGEVTLVVEELRDLNEVLQHRSLVKELQAKVSTLEGLLPICCHCKRIRNPEGDWEEIEHYVSARTDADFSHGICPSCMEKHYPGSSK